MYWGAASESEPTASWIRTRLSEIGQEIRLTGEPSNETALLHNGSLPIGEFVLRG
jgi:hypothetical protein